MNTDGPYWHAVSQLIEKREALKKMVIMEIPCYTHVLKSRVDSINSKVLPYIEKQTKSKSMLNFVRK